jgi:hypothetical protein
MTDNASDILEVSLLGANVLVTFADGMMASFDPQQLRQLASDRGSLRPPPKYGAEPPSS